MKDANVQWHPGFIGAMNLELKKNRDDLFFEKEYNLNTKPLEIDLLVIKKNTDVQIDNEIGRIFRGHNILEYKSPRDELDIDTFYKAAAYASLYKSYGKTLDAVKADDVTVSLVRQAKPYGLFRYFRKHDYLVTNPYRGIYYIQEKVLFPTQIVVTKELMWEEHVWLGSLSDSLEKQNLVELLEEIERLRGKADRESAQSVLEVGLGANKQIFEELIGDESMSEELLEILKPVLEPKIVLREQQIRKEDIKVTVDVLREFGHQDCEIKTALTKKYGLSEKEADSFLQ